MTPRRLVVLLALAGAAVSCGYGAPAARENELRIATTVAPLTSIVANVAGPNADVMGLVPEGSNSHTFEPPPSVARALSRADVLFANGLQLEEPTLALARKNMRKGTVEVKLGEKTVTPHEYIYDFSFPREGGKPNPHLWTNPPMARRYAEIVRDTLVVRDADHAPDYRANFAAFAAKIDVLDDAMRRASGTIPREKRALLTYHDAYAYFARHYGWTVIGAIQPSDFSEPTAREVGDLIAQVRKTGVPAIFGSEVFPSPVLEQIGRETGVRYVDTLRDDDLPGKPGADQHSWLGLMRSNFVTIVAALGGDTSALQSVDTSDVVTDKARYPQ